MVAMALSLYTTEFHHSGTHSYAMEPHLLPGYRHWRELAGETVRHVERRLHLSACARLRPPQRVCHVGRLSRLSLSPLHPRFQPATITSLFYASHVRRTCSACGLVASAADHRLTRWEDLWIESEASLVPTRPRSSYIRIQSVGLTLGQHPEFAPNLSCTSAITESGGRRTGPHVQHVKFPDGRNVSTRSKKTTRHADLCSTRPISLVQELPSRTGDQSHRAIIPMAPIRSTASNGVKKRFLTRATALARKLDRDRPIYQVQ